jgi:hypothetical protein
MGCVSSKQGASGSNRVVPIAVNPEDALAPNAAKVQALRAPG